MKPPTTKLIRTIKLDLQVSPQHDEILNHTISSYTACFNHISAFGWSSNTSNKLKLHKELYYTLKDTYFPKCSQLVISCLSKSSEALKSVFSLKKKRDKQLKSKSKNYKMGKDISCPVSKNQSIRYDNRSMSISLNSKSVSLLTLEGRIDLEFTCNKYYIKYLDNSLFLQDFQLNWKFGSADLVKSISYKNKNPFNKWTLHLTVSSDLPLDHFKNNITNQNKSKTVGVDLGITQPMVDSEGNFYGDPKLWKEIDNNYLRVRKELQSKGTKSAKRRFKAINSRQKRFHKDCNHCLSKQLVSKLNPHDTLVMEELKDIRQTAKANKPVRRLLHNWGFFQLKTFIQYKAQGKLIKVVEIDPKNTSRRCNECGHTERANRSSQAFFSCRGCGFTENADLNASRNIRDKYLMSLEDGKSNVRGVVQPS